MLALGDSSTTDTTLPITTDIATTHPTTHTPASSTVHISSSTADTASTGMSTSDATTSQITTLMPMSTTIMDTTTPAPTTKETSTIDYTTTPLITPHTVVSPTTIDVTTERLTTDATTPSVKTADSILLVIITPICSVIVVLICVSAIIHYAVRQRRRQRQANKRRGRRGRRGEDVLQMSGTPILVARNQHFSITTSDEEEPEKEADTTFTEIARRKTPNRKPRPSPSAPKQTTPTSTETSALETHRLMYWSARSDITVSPTPTPQPKSLLDTTLDEQSPSAASTSSNPRSKFQPARTSTPDPVKDDHDRSTDQSTPSSHSTIAMPDSDDSTLTSHQSTVVAVQVHSPPASPPYLSAVSDRTESTGVSTPPSLSAATSPAQRPADTPQSTPSTGVRRKKQQHVCEKCQKVCLSKAGLLSHMRSHRS